MTRHKATGRWSLVLSGLIFLGVLGWFFGRPTQHAERPALAVNSSHEKNLLPGAGASAVTKALPTQAAKPGATGGASGAAEGRVLKHPSEPLIAGSRLVREQWSAPDVLGNRERSAIYQTNLFKYSRLRVVETWSGKTGRMDSRTVMVADHLLLVARPGVVSTDLEKRVSAKGFTIEEPVDESAMLVSFSTPANDPAELPQRIAELGELGEYAEPDYLVWPCLDPNDPAYAGNKLWGLRNLGGVSGYIAGADIDAPAAWAVGNDASSVVVAVTDTGIRYTHQDLSPNMWRNPGDIQGNGIDDDGNGLIDDVFGYDAYDNDADPMDIQGHGTHCAGTIGARGNDGVGMTGVAWNVRLMAGRFLGPFGGTTSDGIKVINYARQKGAHIISASWGGGGNSQALKNAIAACANAGIPFVAAAGNAGTNNDSLPHYPSSYDLPNIVAVAASNANDNLTDFSCYGRNSVDIAAPGWQIWSTYNGSDTDYRFLHGTSMATPHVSGALALARAQFPDAGVEDLIAALYRSSDKLASLNGRVASGGRLNLHQLLTDSGLKPLNDQFDTPFVLEGSFASWSGGNRAATREGDESSYSPASGLRTMWFAWQAPYEGFASFTTNSLGAGQRVVVFSGDSRSSLKVVYDSGSPAAGVSETVVRFLANAGTPYRIVTASNSGSGELFSLKMELIASNDLLSRALILQGESFETPGSNRGATAQPFETAAPHAGVGGGHSVWFRWEAPVSGAFTLNTEGSETDTVVAVYTGDPLNPSGFTTIGANDDVSGTLRWSRVDFNAVQGVRYYIVVDTAMGGLPGPFILRGASPAVPTVASQPANLQVQLGGRAVFSVGAAGTPPLRYQWFRDGEALPGAWEASLVVDPVTEARLGTFHVVVSNSYGSVTSGNAVLRELRVAPGIVWKTNDIAASSGTAIELSVEARGSQPMTYEWRRNGDLLAGANSASLSLSALTAQNSGLYTCTVTNDAGIATANIRVTVVASPFDAWQWRLDEIPGLPVTEIKVIGGKAYAVAGDRILISTDGLEWSAWMLPSGFEGVSFNKLGSTWLCVGMDAAGNGRSVTSTNGVTWSVPQTLTGLPAVTPLQHLARVEVFNGRFIGQRSTRTTNYGDVYTSTNGIAWTPATLNGTSSSVTASGPFIVDSGSMLTGVSAATNPPRVYRTVNGVDWTTVNLPANESQSTATRGASRWNGGYVLFSSSPGTTYGWISTDGLNWTLQTGRTWTGGVDLNGDFVTLGGTQNDGLSVAWGADPWTATERFIKPATGDIISAYCVFNGRVVYGTQRGFLGSVTDANGLAPFGARLTVPTQVMFADNRFFVLKNSGTGERNLTPSVSGDGSNWRKMRAWTWSSEARHAAFTLVGFGGGRFWGENSNYNAVAPGKGLLPHVMSEVSVANGLPAVLTSFAADGDTLLAIASDKLYRSANAGASWTEVAGAPVIGTSITPRAAVIRSGSRWLLTNAGASWPEVGSVHYSSDGLTWTQTTGKAGFIVPFNGELYGLENLSSGVGNVAAWKSVNNGSTWTAVTMHATNRLANMEVLQLGVFGNALVALVKDNSYVRSVWFSNDGISWFAAATPAGIQGFATGLGQFVAYTSGGAIVQAGAPGVGGAAPVVRVDYPVHESSVVIGSSVEVTGKAFDPEGAAVTVVCQVDGLPVGTSGAGDFRFRFRADSSAGHVVVVRATDAAGLVGSDELRIATTQPRTTNLIDTAEGRDYLPRVAMVEFNGAFYAAGDTGLFRSTDGKLWQPAYLPSLSSKLRGLAAGNGSLVAQTEWGVLYTTRDGVNWSQLGSSSQTTYLISQPIVFSGGRFLILQSVSGQVGVSYRTSVNGLDWTNGGVSGVSATKAMIGDNGVIVAIHDEFYGDFEKAVWSADGGSNWNAIPGIQRSKYVSLGFSMAYGDGVFLIAASDGRVWRSTDGKSWTAESLPTVPTPGVLVRYANGRFFIGSINNLLYSAPVAVGSTWRALSTPIKSDTVIHAQGLFLALGQSGMAWSQDGVTWQNAQGGPTLSIGARLASSGDRVIVIDANGAAWSSDDGTVWQQDFAGISLSAGASTQVGREMAKLGSSIILAGTNGMLLNSTDDGSTWTATKINGQAVPADRHFSHVQVSAGVALATAALGSTSEKTVLRSVDGRDWQTVTSLATNRIVDVAGDGTGTWIAVGSSAALLRSTDHGLTWQTVAGPAMVTARAVAWFNNRWLLFGAVTSGGASRCWSSTDGLSWTDRGPNGLAYSGNDFFRTQGHGRLVVWDRTDLPVITSDGVTWQRFTGYQTFVSNSLYWVAPNVTGFMLATPFISASSPVQMFSGTPNGQSWVEIPRLQTDTLWATALDNRLFFFAPGRVVEWTGADLELELTAASIATVGVGDVVQSPAVFRNLGSGAVSGELEVDGWLSADGFFGDGNDVFLGRVTVNVPLTQPGASTVVSVGFELPGTITPGDSRLVVVLEPDDRFLEKNLSNNVSISSGPAVRVTQHRLELLANGNGSVNSDQNAEYYPHGARIAMVATPGKGARFAGWGGDAVGSFSETLVIMNEDKSVEANFVSTSALTVFTRGGGGVVQSADDGIYVAGTTAQLTAVPLPGWTFSGWSGALAGNESVKSLLMNSPKVVTARFSLGLDAWKDQMFSVAERADSAISGDNVDADGDSLETWREWLRGSDPKSPGSHGQGPLHREGQWVVMNYTRMENMPPGHSVQVSASSDLINWSVPLDERIVGSANGVETIEVRVDVTERPRIFLRIEDTRPAP